MGQHRLWRGICVVLVKVDSSASPCGPVVRGGGAVPARLGLVLRGGVADPSPLLDVVRAASGDRHPALFHCGTAGGCGCRVCGACPCAGL